MNRQRGDRGVLLGDKGIHAAALVRQALHVDIRIDDAAVKQPALCQQRAVFRDQVVPREHKVLRGLAEARVRIQVGAQQARGLLAHQIAAVGRFADDLVRRGQVDDHGRARLREPRGRRVRDPQVFADLHAQSKFRHVRALEHQRLAAREQGVLPEQGDGLERYARARNKVARFVKLGIVRDELLGHNALDFPAAQHRGDVEQLALMHERQADHHGGVQRGRLAAHRVERGERAVQQRALQKQVAAGVPGQAQLGEHDQMRPLCRGLSGQLYDLGSIVCAVCDAQVGRCGSNFDKSILHSCIPPDNSDMVSIPRFPPERKNIWAPGAQYALPRAFRAHKKDFRPKPSGNHKKAGHASAP